jgi:hypothetical protein
MLDAGWRQDIKGRWKIVVHLMELQTENMACAHLISKLQKML